MSDAPEFPAPPEEKPKPYRSCEVTFYFGDDDYLFRLPLKQIAELQEKCGGLDHGGALGSIYDRVMTGQFRIEDLVHTIRLGLIGGGMKPIVAKQKTDFFCEDMPKEELWKVARVVLAATIQGYEVKKKGGETETAPIGSTSQEPMGTAPSPEA